MKHAILGFFLAATLVLLGGCVDGDSTATPAVSASAIPTAMPEPTPEVTPEAVPAMEYAEAVATIAEEEGIALTDAEDADARTRAREDAVLLAAMGEEGDGLDIILEEQYVLEILEKKLAEALFPDVQASAEEILDWYDARLAAMQQAFSQDPGAFKNQQDSFDLYGGVPPLVVPEGYIRVKHILVEEEALAKELHGRLVQGEGFDALLTEYGTDAGMKQEPYLSRGYLLSPHASAVDLLPELKEAALALDTPGAFSEVFSSAAGYHIACLVEQLDAREVPLTEVEGSIATMLTAVKRKQALVEYALAWAG